MANKVILVGRLTTDPVTRYSQNEKATAISNYTLAVDRKYKQEGQPEADFIRCVAYGKNGEFAEKYLKQGTKIVFRAHVITGSYTNREGVKVYTTDFVADEINFAESKGTGSNSGSGEAPASEEGFMDIPDNLEELPFA